MSIQAISVPTIKVNNDVIGIVPNSFKYTPGYGEVEVRAASTGGGNAVSVHTENAETKVSNVMFSVYPTTDNISKIRTWKSQVAANTVEAVQRGISGKDFTIAFKGLSVTNDPEIQAASDGVVEVEMAGDQVL